MRFLPTVVALMALVGLAVIWLRLRAIKKTVEHLAQTHGSATGSQAVEAKGLSLPSGAFSDAITPTELVEERLIILGYRTLVITLDNQSTVMLSLLRTFR